MKRYLKKLVINANLLFTELLKTLLEVEHVLNDKTLCYSYSAEVEEVLMPNCLLYGRHLNSIICGRENLRFRKLLNVFECVASRICCQFGRTVVQEDGEWCH